MNTPLRVIVVGLGVQGAKRIAVAGGDVVASVDTVQANANHTRVQDIPIENYDAALVCTPDDAKLSLLRYLLGHGKHVLVEKPLLVPTTTDLLGLKEICDANRAVCYTAYNHRFEPHFERMRDLVTSGVLGRIFRARLFYGNGTARLVRDSVWRDSEAGVLPDLGSHLLDTVEFWFGRKRYDFRVASTRCYENRAPDHVVLMADGHPDTEPDIELEMSLLSWRNSFFADVIGENGSAHISSLCKWGPSSFTYRERILPSGRPHEEPVTLAQDDPTWDAEYRHFKQLCAAREESDFSTSIWINEELRRLSSDALIGVAP